MISKKKSTMSSEDNRQIMLRENFEIYEKKGSPSGALKLHFHDFYELMYILSGDFSILINNKTYKAKKGDLVLINKNLLHHYQNNIKGEHKSSRILLWITDAFLQSLAPESSFLNQCFASKEGCIWHFPAMQRERLLSNLNELLYLDNNDSYSSAEKEILERSYLSIFFIELNNLLLKNELDPTLLDTMMGSNMLQDLSDYIDAHLAEDLNIDTLAKVVHMSRFHFLHKFKDLTGMTVHNYIIKKRIILSSKLILDGMSLSVIPDYCGFTNYSTFYRNFKSIYGISPKEYLSLYS